MILLQKTIIILLVASLQPLLLSFVIPRQSDNEQINAAIKQLFSANDNERRSATEKIIQFGSIAIKPLISLLEQIIEKPGRFYPSGREKEGAAAYERLQEAFRNGDNLAAEQAREELSQLDITYRLKGDIINLLGELKSEEALPILLRLMWRDLEVEMISKRPRWNNAMKALVTMGGIAVPTLIETLERAESIANSVEYNDVQLSDGTGLTIQSQVEKNKRRIQTRAILVLGEIGDERALTALERMLQGDGELLENQKVYVREAVEKVKDKVKRSAKSV
jgi:HEAT repeat protein